jgi:hypothetical protein
MVWYNRLIALFFVALMGIGSLYFVVTRKHRQRLTESTATKSFAESMNL